MLSDMFFDDFGNDRLLVCNLMDPRLGHLCVSEKPLHLLKFQEIHRYGN